MKETAELLEARARRMESKEKARALEEIRQLKQKALEEKKKLLEDVLMKYPAAFMKFQRLKKIWLKTEDLDVEEKLFWLKVEMLGYRTWDYSRNGGDGPYTGMTGYNENEERIIIEVASSYYQSLERKLWAGRSAEIDEQELIRRIESAGVNTSMKQDYLVVETTYLLSGYSKLWNQLYDLPQYLFELLNENIPDELRY